MFHTPLIVRSGLQREATRLHERKAFANCLMKFNWKITKRH